MDSIQRYRALEHLQDIRLENPFSSSSRFDAIEKYVKDLEASEVRARDIILGFLAVFVRYDYEIHTDDEYALMSAAKDFVGENDGG